MYQTVKEINKMANTVTLSCGHQLKMGVHEFLDSRKHQQWCDICEKQNVQQNAKDTSAPSGGQQFMGGALPTPHMDFLQILKQMERIHRSKNQDYSHQYNKFSNFEQAASLAEWFSDPVDKTFATLIGVKLSRLAILKASGKAPNNESIADTHLDLNVYAVLWHEYTEQQTIKLQTEAPKGRPMSDVSEPEYRAMREMQAEKAGNSKAVSGQAQIKTENKENSGGVSYDPQNF